MLSRVADCLYWMSRHLERAEHTARLLDVNLHQRLDQTPASARRRWDQVLLSLGTADLPVTTNDAWDITAALTFDPARSHSIVACIGAARENARQVREGINSEMWEQLNRLFLHVNRTSMDEIWHAEPHLFFQAVKEGAHLFQGIADATMSHGEGWHFMQVGRYIERATATALLLDTHVTGPSAARGDSAATLDDLQWVGLLKSCTAFEAYCTVYTADIQPHHVAAFLILNAEFPRSLRFIALLIQSALQAIARATGVPHGGRAERLAGRLGATLDDAPIDEIMADDMHSYLADIGRQCAQIHDALYQTYIMPQHFPAPHQEDGRWDLARAVPDDLVVAGQTQTQTQTQSGAGVSENAQQ